MLVNNTTVNIPVIEFNALLEELKAKKINWLSLRVDGHLIIFFSITHKQVAIYNKNTKRLS